MMRHRLFAGLAASMLCVSLVACAGEDEGEDAGDSTTTAADAATTTAPDDAASDTALDEASLNELLVTAEDAGHELTEESTPVRLDTPCGSTVSFGTDVPPDVTSGAGWRQSDYDNAMSHELWVYESDATASDVFDAWTAAVSCDDPDLTLETIGLGGKVDDAFVASWPLGIASVGDRAVLVVALRSDLVSVYWLMSPSTLTSNTLPDVDESDLLSIAEANMAKIVATIG